MFPSFAGISHEPIHPFDKTKFKEWIEKHTRNILMHYPVLNDACGSSESEKVHSQNIDFVYLKHIHSAH